MVDLPERWGAGSPRLRAWLGEIWERLPAPERGLLAHVVGNVLDGPPPGAGLGGCGDLDYPGLTVSIWVDSARILDDRAGVWIVGHELAHASLRHQGLNVIVQTLLAVGNPAFEDPDAAMLRALQELEADLLTTLVWGFGPELDAYLREFPNAKRPRFMDGGEGK